MGLLKGLMGIAVVTTMLNNADAVQFSFVNISHNSAANAAAGEAQLFVDVNPVAGHANQVQFKFLNIGQAKSSITDVYFDDGTLLGIATIYNGPGVDFSQDARPRNLPAGNTINFKPNNNEAFFSLDSDAPVQPNGVNPGEYLTVVFNLINGQTYEDTLAALALGEGKNVDITGALRIGIHVQGFKGGGSESFVNGGRVPDGGATMIMLGAALIGLGIFRRKVA